MPMNHRSIVGRPAIITGAASGIGRSLARRLSRSGSPVAIADIDAAGLNDTAKSLPGPGHATMLQRSPTYILAMPSEDGIATRLRGLLGTRRGYTATRWKNVAVTTLFNKLSRRKPDLIRGWIRQMTVKELPACATISTPTSSRWTTRGTSGCAWCPTVTCSRPSATGAPRWSLTASRALPRRAAAGVRRRAAADIVVTATGLQLLAFGGTELAVDGRPVGRPRQWPTRA